MSSPKLRSVSRGEILAEAAAIAGGEFVPAALDTSGRRLKCEHSARASLERIERYNGLHFDEFLSRMRIDDRDWSDADDLDALCFLQTFDQLSYSRAQVSNACRAVAYARRRDSLKEFIAQLPEWDGTSRIDSAFSDAWGAPDTPLIRAASRNLFIAMIARGKEPGAQVDTVWCFEGKQGTYKSRALRELGGKFHAEISAPIGTADFMRELRGVSLAELAELDSLRGREASTVKRLVSATVDRFVEKYALHADSYPRRAVFVATTNEAEYWQDSTGARRLVPILCGEIRVDLIAANRQQWFAEARELHKRGVPWWEFPDAIRQAQEDRQHVDPWEDMLREFIERGRRLTSTSEREPFPTRWMSSSEIMRDWLKLEPHQQGNASSTRLGRVMRRLGFEPRKVRNERGWLRAEYTSIDADTEVSTQVSSEVPL